MSKNESEVKFLSFVDLEFQLGYPNKSSRLENF